MKKQKEKVILIDGSSYIFRAFFAIQHLTNSKGFPTNAIYGFIHMLLKVLEVEKPKNLVICFDTPKPTFRKKIFAEYKANREAAPEDLVLQFPYIFKTVDAFGICSLKKEGFEADDIIASLCHRAEKDGYEVDIISGDKDLMQLVSPRVKLFDTMRDKVYDQKGVEEKFGVKPHQMVDFLALMGDASDNIPGVSGIGKKTAADLLKEFHSLDGVYENIEKIKQKKRKETLLEQKDQAYLSQKLVLLETNMDLDFSWSASEYKGPLLDQMQPLFEELEFHTLLKKFNFKKQDEAEFKVGAYKAVMTEKELSHAVSEIQKAGRVCLDTETTSLVIQDADLVGISLSWQEGHAIYIPLAHQTSEAPGVVDLQLDESLVRECLRPVLEDPKVVKIGQNLKYDAAVLKRWGVGLQGIEEDTMIASYLLNPDEKHGLDHQALRYLGHQNISFESVVGKGKNQVTFDQVAVEKATQYACEDADVTLRIFEKRKQEIEKEGLLSLYHEIEIPLVPVLMEMEWNGIGVNRPVLEKMKLKLESELNHLKSEIYALAGKEFNINSPKQLGDILFNQMEIPPVRKTKTGFSTDEKVLQTLASKHPIADYLLKFREYGKLKSTYVEGLLGQIHPTTHKIHTHFNQTVTATGRLSSSNPNLQNIPVGVSKDFDIRGVFVPQKGMRLFAADYSQIELRLLAHMSGDAELCRAFEQDEDVHAHTGRLIFDTQDITKAQRNVAKTINFGVIYGQTPYGLSQQLGISPFEAKSFIEQYFERYEGVESFLKQTILQAREEGQVRTLFGRRRFLPEINSQNRMRREMAERTATNTPLQGTAADLIKKAMVGVSRRLNQEKLRANLLLQVHDELILEAPAEEEKKVEQIVVEEMENAMSLRVPLKVDTGWGSNWRECK